MTGYRANLATRLGRSVIEQLRRAGGVAVRALRSAGEAVQRRYFANREPRPLYLSTPLDDVLFAHPLDMVMRIVHWLGSRRATAAHGSTIVVVNWNTRDILHETLRATRRYSAPGTPILVIDNHSTDGSRDWLKRRPFGVRPVLLPFNIHHGRALDLGFALARTPIVITLDSDAFPYREGWLDLVEEPITSGRAVAAGMWGRRDRLHPACAAYRRDTYFASNLSFSPFFSRQFFATGDERFGENIWDTGELISEAMSRDGVEILPVTGLEFGGSSMADAVYHHGALSRLPELNDAQREMTHEQAWHLALDELLGPNRE